MEIIYLCDRKACEHCSKECKYTTNIKHAVNFENINNDYFIERETKITEPKEIFKWLLIITIYTLIVVCILNLILDGQPMPRIGG